MSAPDSGYAPQYGASNRGRASNFSLNGRAENLRPTPSELGIARDSGSHRAAKPSSTRRSPARSASTSHRSFEGVAGGAVAGGRSISPRRPDGGFPRTATARSRVIEGIMTTLSSAWLSRIADQTVEHSLLEHVETFVPFGLAELRQSQLALKRIDATFQSCSSAVPRRVPLCRRRGWAAEPAQRELADTVSRRRMTLSTKIPAG